MKRWQKVLLGGGVAFLAVASLVRAKSAAGGKSTPTVTTLPEVTSITLSEHDADQAEYQAEYGIAPEGFEWASDGTLVALSDDTLSAEDVAFTFMQGISSLDFSTAQRYSEYSSVVSTYEGFFSTADGSVDYYQKFIQGVYKSVLQSMQVVGTKDSSVFADGTTVLTLTVSCLDLSDKTFWQADRDKLFADLYNYTVTEKDTVASDIYLYNYIIDYYAGKYAEPKRSNFDVTLTLTKGDDGGWLVADDSTVNALCSYTMGTSVVEYIEECFSESLNSN